MNFYFVNIRFYEQVKVVYFTPFLWPNDDDTAPANVDINGNLDDENTPVGAEVRIINLQMTVSHLEELKLYALQRSNKEFSNKKLKLIIELENLVFMKPKNYVQTQLNFYSH